MDKACSRWSGDWFFLELKVSFSAATPELADLFEGLGTRSAEEFARTALFERLELIDLLRIRRATLPATTGAAAADLRCWIEDGPPSPVPDGREQAAEDMGGRPIPEERAAGRRTMT